MSLRSLWGRLARLEKKQPQAPADHRPISWDWLCTRRDDGYDPADVARWKAALTPRLRPEGHPIEVKINSVK